MKEINSLVKERKKKRYIGLLTLYRQKSQLRPREYKTKKSIYMKIIIPQREVFLTFMIDIYSSDRQASLFLIVQRASQSVVKIGLRGEPPPLLLIIIIVQRTVWLFCPASLRARARFFQYEKTSFACEHQNNVYTGGPTHVSVLVLHL